MTGRLLRRVMAGVALLAVVGLVGCSDPTNNQTVGKERIVNIYLTQKPKIWSPLAPGFGADQQVMSFIWRALIQADNKEQLQPILAEKYDVSPDATTFTFHLRKDVKWSDGAPFTSKDL